MRIMNSILARIIAGSVLWFALSPLVPAAEKAPVATAARAPGAAAKATWLERALQPGGSPLGQPCKEYLTANGLAFKTRGDSVQSIIEVNEGKKIHPAIASANFDCHLGSLASAELYSKLYKGTNGAQAATKMMEQLIGNLHLSESGWTLAATGTKGDDNYRLVEGRIFKRGDETLSFSTQFSGWEMESCWVKIEYPGQQFPGQQLWSEKNWLATLIRTGEFPKGLECDKYDRYITLPNNPDEWPGTEHTLDLDVKKDFTCVDGVVHKFVLHSGVFAFRSSDPAIIREWSDTNIARLRLKENGWRLVYQDPPGKSRLGGLTIAARAFQKGDKTILWEERYRYANPKEGVWAVITYPGRYPGQ